MEIIGISGNIPIINNNFYKFDLLGYDVCHRSTYLGLGTFIAFKKTETSGSIINTSSTNWCCLKTFEGKDGDKIKIITENCINLLLDDEYLF